MAIEKETFSWKNRGKYWLPLISYMVLIFYLSSQPLEKLQLPTHTDKIFHGIEYGILGILWLRALRSSSPSANSHLLAFLLTFLYGISDEVHQMFVPHRSSSVFDVLADGIGGWMGIGIYMRKWK